MNQREECCKQCPYARATTKEYLDTKGSNASRFAGQAEGPFLLPCHMAKDFEEWANKADTIPQCAGAAKYRANIGADERMPSAIGRLEKDTETVFSHPAELIAHHEGLSIEEAAIILTFNPTREMLRMELERQNNVKIEIET